MAQKRTDTLQERLKDKAGRDAVLFEQILLFELHQSPSPKDAVPLFVLLNDLVPYDMLSVEATSQRELLKLFDVFLKSYKIDPSYDRREVLAQMSRWGVSKIKPDKSNGKQSIYMLNRNRLREIN